MTAEPRRFICWLLILMAAWNAFVITLWAVMIGSLTI